MIVRRVPLLSLLPTLLSLSADRPAIGIARDNIAISFSPGLASPVREEEYAIGRLSASMDAGCCAAVEATRRGCGMSLRNANVDSSGAVT